MYKGLTARVTLAPSCFSKSLLQPSLQPFKRSVHFRYTSSLYNFLPFYIPALISRAPEARALPYQNSPQFVHGSLDKLGIILVAHEKGADGAAQGVAEREGRKCDDGRVYGRGFPLSTPPYPTHKSSQKCPRILGQIAHKSSPKCPKGTPLSELWVSLFLANVQGANS